MTSRPEHVIVDELDPDHSPLPISQPTIQDVSETAVDLKDTHTGWTLGGSVLGEYLPLPKGTGAVVGGAIGYGVSKLKRKTLQRISSKIDNWLSSKDFSLFNKDVKVNRSNAFGPGAADASQFKRFSFRDVQQNSNVLTRLWNQKGDVRSVEKIIQAMDDWRLSHTDLERPMTGFTRNFGRKPTFKVDGVEYGIGWSRKKNNYEVFNVEKELLVDLNV